MKEKKTVSLFEEDESINLESIYSDIEEYEGEAQSLFESDTENLVEEEPTYIEVPLDETIEETIKPFIEETPKEEAIFTQEISSEVPSNSHVNTERKKKGRTPLIGKKKKVESIKNKTVEEIERDYRKRNRNSILFLISFFVGVILVAVIFFTFYSNSSGRELQKYLDNNDLALAYEYIETSQQNGHNVDRLVETFVETCISLNEIRRITPAMELLSNDFNKNGNFFREVIEQLYSMGDIRQVNTLLIQLENRGGEYSQLAYELLGYFEGGYGEET